MPSSPQDKDMYLPPVTEADGSTRFPGFVIRPDGTLAAEDERRQPPLQQHLPALVRVPSNDELTAVASEQVRDYIQGPISPYRPSSPEQLRNAKPEAYGRIVQIQANATATGVWTPLLDHEKNWMVVIQPLDIAFEGGTDITGVLVTMQWMVGGATFRKQFVIDKSVIYRFPVNGRQVLIDLEGINSNSETFHGQVLSVAVAVGCGDDNFVQGLSGVWYPFSTIAQPMADQYQLLPGNVLDGGQSFPITSGYLMSAVVIATVLTATPLYPMFFDLDPNVFPLPLPNGVAPFLVGTPLQNVGDVASLDDEFASSWAFQSGLQFALSTTADTYTASPAGSKARVDFKVGV